MLTRISTYIAWVKTKLSRLRTWTNSATTLLRSLRLQVLTQATKWRLSQEPPKVAIYNDRKVALLHGLIHLPAVVAALLLMIWNSCGFLVGDKISSSATTGLQFPAKIFELLMQASLATILLGIIRRCMTQSTPLPLGSVLAPPSVTNLSYLWSLEYLGFLECASWKHLHCVALVAFTTCTVVLAAVVGPSGAVLMIPRPIEYPYYDALIYVPDEADLYPREVGFDHNPGL